MTNALWEPRHHAIVTIDIEGFGSPTRTDPIRAGLRRTLDEIIQTALQRIPHADPLSATGDTGDGGFLLFRSDLPKTSILQDFAPALEVGVRHHNRSASTAATLRLRIGVHHGEVTVDKGGHSGEQLNHAFRIIDNDVIRHALKMTRSDIEVISVGDVSVFEMGEYQGGVGDVADLLRARGDVLQDSPALAEQGEAAFADTA